MKICVTRAVFDRSRDDARALRITPTDQVSGFRRRSFAKNVDGTEPFAQSGVATEMHPAIETRYSLGPGRPRTVVTAELRHYSNITPALSSGDPCVAASSIRCAILFVLQLVRFQHSAPVAQLDRAMVYETIGREFEPLRARHLTSIKSQSCSRCTTTPRSRLWSSVVEVSFCRSKTSAQ